MRISDWSSDVCSSDLTVRRLARGLAALGVRPGDRVVLVSENRPEWAMADLAIMAAGAVTVPAYTTNTVDDHLYILDHAGAVAAIVSTGKLARRVIPAARSAEEIGRASWRESVCQYV